MTSEQYYRARYYDPGTSRFLSEDALRFKAAMNFYGYVQNNPLAYVDPYGQSALCPSWLPICPDYYKKKHLVDNAKTDAWIRDVVATKALDPFCYGDHCRMSSDCPFRRLDAEGRRQLRAGQHTWRARRGQIIYVECTPADGVYILCDGSVKLLAAGKGSAQFVDIGMLGLARMEERHRKVCRTGFTPTATGSVLFRK